MRDALGHLTGLVALVWWAPTILLAVAALVAERARYGAALALVDALVAFGRRDAARRACEAELRRCERRRRELEGRRLG